VLSLIRAAGWFWPLQVIIDFESVQTHQDLKGIRRCREDGGTLLQVYLENRCKLQVPVQVGFTTGALPFKLTTQAPGQAI
jgi:hypothetical protein